MAGTVWDRADFNRLGPKFTAVYDAITNQMMAFGGNNDEGVFFVTWVLSDANGL